MERFWFRVFNGVTKRNSTFIKMMKRKKREGKKKKEQLMTQSTSSSIKHGPGSVMASAASRTGTLVFINDLAADISNMITT